MPKELTSIYYNFVIRAVGMVWGLGGGANTILFGITLTFQKDKIVYNDIAILFISTKPRAYFGLIAMHWLIYPYFKTLYFWEVGEILPPPLPPCTYGHGYSLKVIIETQEMLQHPLNIFENHCKAWGLDANLVIIFSIRES